MRRQCWMSSLKSDQTFAMSTSAPLLHSSGMVVSWLLRTSRASRLAWRPNEAGMPPVRVACALQFDIPRRSYTGVQDHLSLA